MTILLTVLLVISSVALIVSVLMQSGKSAGMGSIAGGAEQLFGQGDKLDALFSKVTTASAVCFMVSTLLLTILQ